MTKEIKLPELGENIESAEVVDVLVKAGDTIQKDQSIIEIETDKATVEVPSIISGRVSKVNIKKGDSVKVGQTILTVEEIISSKQDEPIKEKSSADKKIEKVTKKGEVIEFKVPALGENVESVDVTNVLVKKGDVLIKDQIVIEIETDKATVEVPSSVQGKILKVNVNAGDKVKFNDVILSVESSQEFMSKTDGTEKHEEEKTKSTKEEKPIPSGQGSVRTMKPEEMDEQTPINRKSAPAAPSVRRIARELGVDINQVLGSGENGRISMDDVKAFVKKIILEGDKSGGIGIKKEVLPDFSKYGNIERVSMSKIREKTASHLSYAWAFTPHVTQFDKADITQFEKSRKELNAGIKKEGGKLTVTSILIKIISEGLEKFPQFNSSVDMDNNEIVYKKYLNIGVAVDTEYGLLVPVIKNVNKKDLVEISIELGQLAQKARDKKLSLEEMQGGCFTITNLGGIGGTYFTPIINSPEVAILGMSRANYEPVYTKDEIFEPKLMLPLSLSYDHRIIDGADAIRFLRWVCEALEQPLKIFM